MALLLLGLVLALHNHPATTLTERPDAAPVAPETFREESDGQSTRPSRRAMLELDHAGLAEFGSMRDPESASAAGAPATATAPPVGVADPTETPAAASEAATTEVAFAEVEAVEVAFAEEENNAKKPNAKLHVNKDSTEAAMDTPPVSNRSSSSVNKTALDGSHSSSLAAMEAAQPVPAMPIFTGFPNPFGSEAWTDTDWIIFYVILGVLVLAAAGGLYHFYQGRNFAIGKSIGSELIVTVGTVSLERGGANTLGYQCLVLNCPSGKAAGVEPTDHLLRQGHNASQRTGVNNLDVKWKDAMVNIDLPKGAPEIKIVLYKVHGPSSPRTSDAPESALAPGPYIGSVVVKSRDVLEELEGATRGKDDALPEIRKKYHMKDKKNNVVATATVGFYRPNYDKLAAAGFPEDVLKGRSTPGTLGPSSLMFVRALDEARAISKAKIQERTRGDSIEEASRRAQMQVLAKLMTANFRRLDAHEGRWELVWFEADAHFLVWHTAPQYDDHSSPVLTGGGPDGAGTKVVAGFIAIKHITGVEEQGGNFCKLKYTTHGDERDVCIAANHDDPVRNHDVLLEALQMLAALARAASMASSHHAGGDSSPSESGTDMMTTSPMSHRSLALDTEASSALHTERSELGLPTVAVPPRTK